MAPEDQEPKIVSDSDWKTQARREKDRLAEKERQDQQPASTPEPDAPDASAPREVPPATFVTLINSLVVQSLYFLGRLPDPSGQEPTVNLDLAKHNIDLIQMLEEKTNGNLTEDESKALALSLHELRMQYVQSAHV